MSFPKIISLLFHPLWIPALIYLSARAVDPLLLMHPSVHYYLLILLILCIVAPAISMLVMVRFGLLSGLELHDRKERTGPYIIVMAYYALCFVLLKWKMEMLPPVIFRFFLAVVVSLALALLINVRWKISMHMLALGGYVGTMLGLNIVDAAPVIGFLVLSVLAAGITGYARIALNAHAAPQVYAGFVLGALVNAIAVAA